MHRRTFLKTGLASVAVAAGASRFALAEGLKPPNILWLSAEDLSPDLGCYGDDFATTPNIDAFAQRAIRYDRAFSHSGVCAPSRSGLITGMYPTTIGTDHMRCSGIPPAGVKCFTEYLRGAGYYCTNNSKTDYQFEPPLSAWDENSTEAHWKKRPEGAPFFSVFNFTTTHEGQVRSRDPKRLAEIEGLGELRHAPPGVTLPPYHADTPVVRKDWAQYHDLITLMDREVGAALAELETAGLAEDTIVWFWGDHGRGLTRCKRWLYESGTRVPLLVHVPEKYRAWVRPTAPETLASGTDSELVSFIDFAPTILSLAGVSIPAHLQGQAFLGRDQAPPREYVYGARDRMDEAYDCIRTVRDKRFRYFRNYMAWLPYAQTINYMDEMPMAQELRRLNAAGGLNADQARWFAPAKPLEELYDVEADPHELNNLAEDPAYADVLQRLREAHLDWSVSTRDAGLIPEPELDAMKWPGGEIPHCAPPLVARVDGKLVAESATPGASIVYRWSGDPADRWRLYAGPVPPRDGQALTALAARAGYKNSPEAGLELAAAAPAGGRALRDAGLWAEEAEHSGLLHKLREFRALDFNADESVPAYLSALQAPEASIRYWAVVALHRMVKPELRQPNWEQALLQRLEDGSPVVRVAAARALCDWGRTETALPVLESALDDASQSVRLHAVIALRDIGEAARAALPRMAAAAKDPWTYVGRVSAQVMAGLGVALEKPASTPRG